MTSITHYKLSDPRKTIIADLYCQQLKSSYTKNAALVFVIFQYINAQQSNFKRKYHNYWFAQSAGAVEYTDCFSAEG